MEFLSHSEKNSKSGIQKSNEANGTNRGLFEARIFGECFSFYKLYCFYIFFRFTKTMRLLGVLPFLLILMAQLHSASVIKGKFKINSFHPSRTEL